MPIVKHPYKVTFKLPSDEGCFKLLKFVLAINSNKAKKRISKAYNVPGNEAIIHSARKVKMSKCAFYKKFGKEATEKYFNIKIEV